MMNKALLVLSILSLLGLILVAQAFAQNDSGINLRYLKEQDHLQKLASGQNFCWEWSLNSSQIFQFDFECDVNGRSIKRYTFPGKGIRAVSGSLSIRVEPRSNGSSKKLNAFYDLGVSETYLDSKGQACINADEMQDFYFGEAVNKGPKEEWPSEYKGTPLYIVFRNGILIPGRKTLLAESVRLKPTVFWAPEESIHEFAVYITVNKDTGLKMPKLD